MTLPPIISWDVRGVAGPKYKVGPWCANPRCHKPAEHAHHIWRRSALGGPFDWVELSDEHVLGNLVGLCVGCHDQITGRVGGHKAAIRLDNVHRFWWCEIGGDGEIVYEPVAPLDPQPPAPETLVASPAKAEPDTCPTCGQPHPRRRSPRPPGERRRGRKTWPVKVPADAEENGAEVLDLFTDDLAPLLGISPDEKGGYASGRYYVLVPALYYAQINREDFIRTTKGQG